MAHININEISQNYSYNVATSSYATVALPITACWGPGYFDPNTYFPDEHGQQENYNQKVSRMLEQTHWLRFPSSQEGLEKFVATYRGPSTPHRLANDYSYQMAMTLLTAGYDILVCRLCPGAHASVTLKQGGRGLLDEPDVPQILMRAKYPGTFGNNLSIQFTQTDHNSLFKQPKRVGAQSADKFWTVTTYLDNRENRTRTALETHYITFHLEFATDQILYYKDIESKYWEIIKVTKPIKEASGEEINDIGQYNMYSEHMSTYVQFDGGTDYNTEIGEEDLKKEITKLEKSKYDNWVQLYYNHERRFKDQVYSAIENKSLDFKRIALYRTWLYSSVVYAKDNSHDDAWEEQVTGLNGVYDLLKDKLSYNPNRVISPGWDDQDYLFYYDDLEMIQQMTGQNRNQPNIQPSPIALKLLDVAANSRCATAYIDIPRCLNRQFVKFEGQGPTGQQYKGYADALAQNYQQYNYVNKDGLLTTHAALFAPWGQYQYVGTSKMVQTSPSFLALMIQRAQILNQPIQYEWALPTNRKHNLRIGKLDWTVPKHLLDKWQSQEGVNINAITTLPDLGTNIWGNSTLFDTPPATYQALANLSTRLLVNAIEDVVYRVGLSITFQYNNDQAISKFYAGVSPILDTLKNVGAIEDYKIKMNPDIRGLDHVNANTLIGKVYIKVFGVVNDIDVDLICLPPGADF